MWIFGNETSVTKVARFVIYCYIHYPFCSLWCAFL